MTDPRRHYEAEHKRRGLCVQCARPAEEGRVRCMRHLREQRRDAKARSKQNRGEMV